MNPKRMTLWIALAAATLLAGRASATVLVNDTFTDNERSTQNLPASVQWLGVSSSTPLDASSGSLVLPLVSNSAAMGFFTASGSPLTLNVGDTLKFSFTITTPASGANTGDNSFLFGLLNSGGNRPTSDGTFNNSIYNNDVGYFAVAPLAGSHPTRNKIVQRTAGANNLITSANFEQLGSGAATPNLTAGETYTYSLTLVRDSATQITLTSNMGGVELMRVDTAGLVTDFDTLYISTGSNPAVTIDNIKLEYTAAPEPATLGLLAIGGVMVFNRRR